MPDSIVVLDSFTANPGDLDWNQLAGLAPLRLFDRTASSDVVPRAQGASIVLTNKTPISASALEALPGLRYIGVLATGWNVVDAAAARAAGIPVCNVPGYSTASVAQAVFALLLELTHGAGRHASAVRAGAWSRCADFSFWEFPLIELAGRTFGIAGYGQIGRAVARIAQAFEMTVIASRRDGRPGREGAVEFVSTTDLFRRSDVLSLHCPLTPQTEKMINAQSLRSMKSSAYLLNTGRGGLIAESDLAEALNSSRLAGAGLDVLGVEPPKEDNPLLTAKNCVITPHYAWATREARARLIAAATENVRAFLAGRPQNVVN